MDISVGVMLDKERAREEVWLYDAAVSVLDLLIVRKAIITEDGIHCFLNASWI